MKIPQMNAGQAYECMVRMVPHAAELVCDPQIAEVRKSLLSGHSPAHEVAATDAKEAHAAEPLRTGRGPADGQSKVWNFMAKAYPLLLGKHRRALLGIVAALSGKTVDEVRAQPLGETMTVIRAGFTGELFGFFAVCRAFGAQRVTWLLHRYRPFTVDALLELARHDAAERRVAMYAADMVWLVAGRLTRGRFEVRAPSEIAREAFCAEDRARDTRSGAQIVADLAARLREKA